MSDPQPKNNFFKRTDEKLDNLKVKLKSAFSPTQLAANAIGDPGLVNTIASPEAKSSIGTSVMLPVIPCADSASPMSKTDTSPRPVGQMPSGLEGSQSTQNNPYHAAGVDKHLFNNVSLDNYTINASRVPSSVFSGQLPSGLEGSQPYTSPMITTDTNSTLGYQNAGRNADTLTPSNNSSQVVADNISLFSGAYNVILNNPTFNSANTITNVGTGSEAQSTPGQVAIRQKPNSSQRFVGRKEILEKLKVHFASRVDDDRRYFLLSGMGGIGKTQICLKLSEEMSNDFDHIFWIDASSSDTIAASLTRLSNLPEARSAGVDGSAQFILHWISCLPTKWLLILDNADGAPEVVEKFIPPGSKGNILVTSRNPSVGRITSFENSLELAQMEEDDSISLLLTASGLESTAKDLYELAQRIVTALCCLPLAVDQAGASIASGLCSIEEYLGLFSAARKYLMQHSSFMGASAYERTVYGTWELSYKEIEMRAAATTSDIFKQLAAQNALAILQICAFYHHDNITEDIFCNAAELSRKRDIAKEESRGLPLAISALDYQLLSVNEHGVWNKILFRQGIEVLVSFSLVKLGASAGSFSIHPLVHHWSQDRLTIKEQQAACLMGRNILACAVPTSLESEDYDFRRLLWPHVKANHQYGSQVLLPRTYKDDECLRFAEVYKDCGDWNEVEKLYIQMLEGREKKLGHKHPDTVGVMTAITVVYSNLGKWKEAEALGIEVFEATKNLFGSKHPETLVSMANLASYFSDQGKFKECEELTNKVLKARRKQFGPEHVATLHSMSELASYYTNQKRPKEAEKLQIQVLEARKKSLGIEHRDTLHIMTNLAVTYSQQERWKEAEALSIYVLETRTRLLGPEHPLTILSMGELASNLQRQGKFDESMAMTSQVLEARKRLLGPEHPYTLQSMGCLATIYSHQGKKKDCEALSIKVLEARKRLFGPDHPETLRSMSDLAANCAQQDNWNKVEELETQVTKARKKVLGPKHPDTLASMARLAQVLHKQSHAGRAIDLMQNTVALYKQINGAQHPETIRLDKILKTWRAAN
ncbi:hypothetical protein B0H34DRAFT_796307 [Crassisporium funariophilum]|nr:hypothetical protein B0H34DRAFT_796307 [Crassisporium funariophilum]